jgi:hypothetical protein
VRRHAGVAQEPPERRKVRRFAHGRRRDHARTHGRPAAVTADIYWWCNVHITCLAQ